MDSTQNIKIIYHWKIFKISFIRRANRDDYNDAIYKSIGPVIIAQLSDLYIVVDEKCEWVRGKPNISCLVL